MSTITLERPESVEKLIGNALPPDAWKDHIENDLMKFWDIPEAYTLDGGKGYLTWKPKHENDKEIQIVA